MSMSSTAVNADSGRAANGAARRTRPSNSSTSQVSIAAMATTCWASTSSGLAGDPQRLDGAGAHPLGDHGGLHQIAAVLGEDDARRDRADLMPGPPDALQPGRDRGR